MADGGEQIGVLVTGAGAPPGVSILKALRSSALPLRLVCTDADPVSVGLFRADAAYTAPLAAADPDAYLGRLAEICRKETLRLIFLGSETEMRVVAPRKAELERASGAVCVLNDAGLIEIFTDKWETARALRERGIGAPRSVLPGDSAAFDGFRAEIPLPYIVKPRFGSGSKGLFVAKNDKELEFFVTYVEDPVVQELLLPADEEYTVGAYKSARSAALGMLTFRRSLAAGLTYKARIAEDAEIETITRRFAESFPVWGPFNIQLRKTPQGPRIFEVNLRPSSSVVMRAYFGFNEPELCVRDLVLEEALDFRPARSGWSLRYWDEVFVEESVVEQLRASGELQQPLSEKLALL